jgi:hypothetical protein
MSTSCLVHWKEGPFSSMLYGNLFKKVVAEFFKNVYQICLVFYFRKKSSLALFVYCLQFNFFNMLSVWHIYSWWWLSEKNNDFCIYQIRILAPHPEGLELISHCFTVVMHCQCFKDIKLSNTNKTCCCW